jgi:hypothetical protein
MCGQAAQPELGDAHRNRGCRERSFLFLKDLGARHGTTQSHNRHVRRKRKNEF